VSFLGVQIRGQASPTFVNPVDNLQITQNYAAYGLVVVGKYHTGIDAIQQGVDPYSYTTLVKAAGSGIVKKIFGINISGNNLRRWNSTTNTYSWESAPTSGSNHGLGICIIIYHPDLQLYTLYGHLDAVVAGLTVGQSVVAGQIIGRMGNSHQQYLRRCPSGHSCPVPSDAPSGTVVSDANGFGPHIHFEVKDRGVLSAGRIDDCDSLGGCYWGYTPGPSPSTSNMPGHPNWFGYHDPNIFLNLPVQKLAQPIPVEVMLFPLNVRDYPSTSSRVITQITQRSDGKLPAFVAIRSVGNEWYQIYLPNASNEGWSASGWIAGTLEGTTYSKQNNGLSQLEVIPEWAPIYAQASSTSSKLVYVYGGGLANPNNPQRFVPFESVSGWYRIYLPQKSSQPDGWIRSNDVQFISGETLSVSLSANPSSGPVPLNTNLKADVSGTASGTINYTFWWNCDDPGTSVDQVMTICGSIPTPTTGTCTENQNGIKCDAVWDDPKTVNHIYSAAGSYTAKVIAERGSALPAEARVSITVTPPAETTLTYTFTTGWSLFSVPLDPVNRSPSAVLCDDLNPCYTVYRWNVSRNSWDQNPDIIPGQAYWIYAETNTSVDAQGTLISGSGLVQGLVTGTTAWNMIGQPYNFAVKLLDFQVWKTSTEGWITIRSAAQKGYLYKWAYFYYKSGNDWGWYAVNLIDNRVYLTIWDQVDQKYGPWVRQSFNTDQVTLNPWRGVWLWSYIDGMLSIPANPTSPFPLGISHQSKLGPERASHALSTELSHYLPPLPPSPGEKIELKVFEVQVCPNPVTGGKSVAFTAQGEGIRDIKVEIYDLSGRQVFESGYVGNGFQWNLQTHKGRIVANGIYLYVVKIRGFNGETFTSKIKKLVILR
jgi:murein DD-endopeptidase MepM/ murein hydrolase activator NlpD